MLLKQPAENVFDFRLNDWWAQAHDKLIDDDPLGQVKFCAFIQSYCVKVDGESCYCAFLRRINSHKLSYCYY